MSSGEAIAALDEERKQTYWLIQLAGIGTKRNGEKLLADGVGGRGSVVAGVGGGWRWGGCCVLEKGTEFIFFVHIPDHVEHTADYCQLLRVWYSAR